MSSDNSAEEQRCEQCVQIVRQHVEPCVDILTAINGQVDKQALMERAQRDWLRFSVQVRQSIDDSLTRYKEGWRFRQRLKWLGTLMVCASLFGHHFYTLLEAADGADSVLSIESLYAALAMPLFYDALLLFTAVIFTLAQLKSALDARVYDPPMGEAPERTRYILSQYKHVSHSLESMRKEIDTHTFQVAVQCDLCQASIKAQLDAMNMVNAFNEDEAELTTDAERDAQQHEHDD